MMGRHHALFGAVAWFGPASVVFSRSPSVLVLSTACAGAAAMLPDLDEPGSSVAHVLEPVSGAVSEAMAALCGGHRKASHSLIGVAVVTVLMALALLSPVAAAVAVGLLLLIAFRGLGPPGLRHGVLVLAMSGACAYGVAASRLDVAWLPWAVGVGYVLHLVGDMLTAGGVPLFWPSKRRVAWPVLGHTNSGRERVFGVGLLVLAVGLILASGLVQHLHLAHLSGIYDRYERKLRIVRHGAGLSG